MTKQGYPEDDFPDLYDDLTGLELPAIDLSDLPPVDFSDLPEIYLDFSLEGFELSEEALREFGKLINELLANLPSLSNLIFEGLAELPVDDFFKNK